MVRLAIFLSLLVSLALSYRPAPPRVVSFVSSRNISCELTVRYQAAGIEQKWFDSINDVADNTAEWTKGCAMMREQKDEIMHWLEAGNQRARWIDKPDRGMKEKTTVATASSCLSYHHYEEKCGRSTRSKVIPLEPLIGFLRHPLGLCFHGYYLSNKSYMLPMFDHERITDHPIALSRGNKRYLFDLGASLYTSGSGGASQQWFVDTYRAHGLPFDRVLAWEASPYKPERIFDNIPPDVIGIMSYFNIPAATGLNDRHNPLRILKKICSVEDFVVLKIDIDNDLVESKFIQQILSDSAISDRIDELYFEHHVNYSPMEHNGWGLEPKLANITQSYEIFTAMRNLGIRAHSWV